MQCPVCADEARNLTPKDFDFGGVVVDCVRCDQFDVANGFYWEKLVALPLHERSEILVKVGG
jgi:hypothetical protein